MGISITSAGTANIITSAGNDDNLNTIKTADMTVDYNRLYTGWNASASAFTWSRQRGSFIYKTAEYLGLVNSTSASTGIIDVWTPANTTLRPRIMRVYLSTTATTGRLAFEFKEVSGASYSRHVIGFRPTTALSTFTFDFDQGVPAEQAISKVILRNSTGATCDVWYALVGVEE
jgi:hypothetical protein